MRGKAIVPLLACASIAVFALIGCSSEPTAEESAESTEPTASDQTTVPSDPATEAAVADEAASDDDAAEPWEGVVSGFERRPVTFGDWVVTVQESEYGRATDDVSVPSGMTRLEIEVDLENRSGAPASVFPQDWSLTDGAGGRYTVLPAQQPEKQGETSIETGETEDVTMSFAVPGPSERHVLRFQPLGSVGALEVSLR